MNRSMWDIFADEKSSGSFWAAAQISLQLRRRGESVRLFVAGHQSESFRWASFLDSAIELDNSIEICDASQAHFEVPADRVIQVWGARAPATYLHQLIQSDSHWCFDLDAPNSSRMSLTPLSPLIEMNSCRHVAVQMGSTPRHAGYLKYGRSLRRSARLTDLYKDRQAMLAGMGLSSFPQQSAYFVLMSGEAAFDPCPFVRMLRETLRPTVLLIEPGSVQVALACAFGVPFEAGGSLQLDQLTLVFLPEMNWQAQDDCIILSDLVISSELSLCWRACCLGTPLVCGFPESAQSPLLEWYCQGSVSAPHVLLKNLSTKLLRYVDLPEAWHWYWSCLPDFEDHAYEIQQRVLCGPDLVGYLTKVAASQREAVSVVAPPHA